MKPTADERISMRTNEQTKRYLQAAATLSGFNSLSNFILSTAYKEAQKIMTDAQGRVLSDRDRDLVLNALDNPATPNANLLKIMEDAANIKTVD